MVKLIQTKWCSFVGTLVNWQGCVPKAGILVTNQPTNEPPPHLLNATIGEQPVLQCCTIQWFGKIIHKRKPSFEKAEFCEKNFTNKGRGVSPISYLIDNAENYLSLVPTGALEVTMCNCSPHFVRSQPTPRGHNNRSKSLLAIYYMINGSSIGPSGQRKNGRTEC